MESNNVRIVDELSDKNISSKNLWIKTKTKEKKDFNYLALSYYQMLNKYIMELSDRAMAPQDIFNKLVEDSISLYKKGFSLDESASRYSYEPENGFIIENPSEKQSDIYNSQFIRNLLSCIFGYGIPEFYVDFNACNFITDKQLRTLFASARIIEIKMMISLRLAGFKEDLVTSEFAFNEDKYMRNLEIVETENYANKMEEFYNRVILEDKKREESIKLEKVCH